MSANNNHFEEPFGNEYNRSEFDFPEGNSFESAPTWDAEIKDMKDKTPFEAVNEDFASDVGVARNETTQQPRYIGQDTFDNQQHTKQQEEKERKSKGFMWGIKGAFIILGLYYFIETIVIGALGGLNLGY